MRLLTASVLIVLTAASAASAQARLTDGQYAKLARCVGLTKGSGADASALEAAFKAAGRGRSQTTFERAMTAHDRAAKEIRQAGGERLQRLEAERDGDCKSMAA